MKRYLVLILAGTLLFLPACSLFNLLDRPQESVNTPEIGVQPEDHAYQALSGFFQLLNQGNFTAAALLYGGTYEMLHYFNPEIDPDDQISLLQAGCEFNGLMCLPVLSATLIADSGQGEFLFAVIYANPDGNPFVLGPCCGASEEDMPPVSEFSVHVLCEREDACLVLDLPPFVP